MSAPPATGRILFKVPLKTIADRRARRAVPTVPAVETEFDEVEQAIFRALERRVTRNTLRR
jgi:hypothetical protein